VLVELRRVDAADRADESSHDLAQALVRQADHGHLRDGGVEREAALDLDRRDVLAAGDDHVVDPAGDEEIALGIEIAGIAGEVPAAAQCLGIGVGPAPIALERLVGTPVSH
jgi:hypothetical protein